MRRKHKGHRLFSVKNFWRKGKHGNALHHFGKDKTQCKCENLDLAHSFFAPLYRIDAKGVKTAFTYTDFMALNELPGLDGNRAVATRRNG